MTESLRHTRSVCPVCLRNLPAVLNRREAGQILLEKECPEHGAFSVPVWQGRVDFERWLLRTEPLAPDMGLRCPGNCGLCGEHESGSCCVLLEVTRRCNLRCRYCFANGGAAADDPLTEEKVELVGRSDESGREFYGEESVSANVRYISSLSYDHDIHVGNAVKRAIREIAARCGQPLLQFSGGEPTLRDDLPEMVRYAREAGCSYTQVNTNGIRLAREPDYARRLAEAGLDIVFLQFDGTREDIYETLRGAPLLEVKKEAIRVCAEWKIGVTLVPTVVRGVNDDDLGEMVALAASLAPGVRGIHFQPVSYFGRYPGTPGAEDRYTLDELMTDISDQAGIPVESFMPSRCDHPLCGFHASFLIDPAGGLQPLSSNTHSARSRGCARDNREYVARHWLFPPEEPAPVGGFAEEMDFDTVLYRLRHHSLTLSAMAFQDAMNLNIERLHRCTLHVYNEGRIQPFCSRYLTAIPDEGSTG